MNTNNGWKPMPVEPTTEMQNAGWAKIERQGIDPGDVEIAPIYAAMLAAAPCPASTVEGDAQDERPGFEAWAKKKKMPLARIGEQYDDFWVDHAWNGWQERARVAAFAADDALDAARYRAMRTLAALPADQGHAAAQAALQSAGLDDVYTPNPDQFDTFVDNLISAQQGKQQGVA